jgi:steroid delta-isomerase-like uncharacterized protein
MTTGSGASAAEVALAIFDALNLHDLAQAATLWQPDVVEDVVVIGEFRGSAAVRAFFEELFTAVPDLTFTIDRVNGGDEHAVVQWHAAGSFTGGPFQGIHATGRPIALRGVDVMDVLNGKLKHNTIYAYAGQIGLLTAAQTLSDKAILSIFNAKTDLLKRVATLLPRGRAPTP